MSRSDDVPVEMTRHEIDDAAVERLLRGSAAAEQEPLGLLLSQLRSMSSGTPQPSATLAAMLRDGFTPAPSAAAAPVPEVSRWGRRFAAVAGMSLAVKVLAGTGVAVAAVGTAAGAGVLPEPVRDGVSSVVRTLTPFEVDGDGRAPDGSRPAPAQPATPTLPTPAPMEAPARGAAPQDLPTGEPATTQPPVPAPAGPGVDRRPASTRAEQRPQEAPRERSQEPRQERNDRPSRPPEQRPSPQAGGSDRERPQTARSAEPAPPPADDVTENPAADARVAGSPRR